MFFHKFDLFLKLLNEITHRKAPWRGFLRILRLSSLHIQYQRTGHNLIIFECFEYHELISDDITFVRDSVYYSLSPSEPTKNGNKVQSGHNRLLLRFEQGIIWYKGSLQMYYFSNEDANTTMEYCLATPNICLLYSTWSLMSDNILPVLPRPRQNWEERNGDVR